MNSYGTSTAMATNTWYDEDGNVHIADPNFRTTQGRCSNGHTITEVNRDGQTTVTAE